MPSQEELQMFITNAMSTYEMERQDAMRDTEFTRLPIEFLPAELGAVSEEKELPAPSTDEPFTSDDPGHVFKVGDGLFTEDSDERN